MSGCLRVFGVCFPVGLRRPPEWRTATAELKPLLLHTNPPAFVNASLEGSGDGTVIQKSSCCIHEKISRSVGIQRMISPRN